MDNKGLMVTIRCTTYNHEPYIRQCLDGFVMQKTNFRFEAIVHDDASTDGTATIIREYAEKYPDIIKPIFETENQYSKHDGSIRRIMNEHTHGKYVALCEGDDYWIDPLKLQKQVDFLENNKEFTLCCSNAKILTEKGELDWTKYNNNQTIPTKDIILGGGLFIQTASLLYRTELLQDYPECATQCHVGDYPLQIFAGLKGKVYWFSDKQVAYRFQIGNSWTKINRNAPIEKLLNGWKSEINMLQGMDVYSKFKYSSTFQTRINDYIYGVFFNYPNSTNLLKLEFNEIYNRFSIKQKIFLFFKRTNLYLLYKIIRRIF